MRHIKTKRIILIALTLMFSGCLIMINENNYRALNETHLKHYVPTNIETALIKRDTSEPLIISEINSNHIKTIAKQTEYVWVHLWRPFCSAESCQNLTYLEDWKTKSGKKISTLLVSENYQIGSIIKIINQSEYQHPVFVLENAYYGHKTRATRVKFSNELSNGKFNIGKYGEDDFVFKNGELIFAGNIISYHSLDSILNL